MRRSLKLITGLCYLFGELQNTAWACVVCGTATEASQQAFIISTATLSIVPLLTIGGVAYYLYWVNQRNQPKD